MRSSNTGENAAPPALRLAQCLRKSTGDLYRHSHAWLVRTYRGDWTGTEGLQAFLDRLVRHAQGASCTRALHGPKRCPP
jgi:hypothetical protein